MTPAAATMLRNEIAATVRRYADESDISICEAIGVLAIVEDDLLARLRESEAGAEDAT